MRWVVVVILVASMAAGIYFMARAPGRRDTGAPESTRVTAPVKQTTAWTPAKMAGDPEGYLTFAEAETEQELRDLKAREVSLGQVRGRVSTMLDDARQRLELGAQVLDELKACYKHADAAQAVPVRWQGESRTARWLQQNIMELHPLVESKKHLRAKLEQGITSIDAQVRRVYAQRGKAQETLALIRANHEMVKVDRMSNEVTNRMRDIAAAVKTFGEKDDIDLGRWAVDSPALPDAKDFRKIMDEK